MVAVAAAGRVRGDQERGGTGPFKEVSKNGPITLGGAVLTSAGRLLFKGIIHVAGINMLWRASERWIRDSVRNSLGLAAEKGPVHRLPADRGRVWRFQPAAGERNHAGRTTKIGIAAGSDGGGVPACLSPEFPDEAHR